MSEENVETARSLIDILEGVDALPTWKLWEYP
jgi:hypothetical protein